MRAILAKIRLSKPQRIKCGLTRHLLHESSFETQALTRGLARQGHMQRHAPPSLQVEFAFDDIL